MITALRKRLDAKSEQGFTLIELLVVIIIIGILLAIAVPSYLGFRDRATDSANQANVRAAIPAIEAWAADNDGTAADIDASATTSGYQGMTIALLRTEVDAGISPDLAFGTLLDADSYCVENVGDDYHYSVGYAANNGEIRSGGCPAS